MSLDDAQTTLVVGPNGHGKSTFMDAICYALYNKPFRKINKPQIINSINNKHCLVEIEFSTGKDEFLIRRGMKPNVFEIIKNGELINQEASNRDYQEILEKYILKLTYKSFCQVVILGSASFVPFMQLPTGQRREIIEDLLDIQIFTVMNMILKDKVSMNERNILEVDYRYDLACEKIKMQEDHIRSMATSSKDLIESFNEKIRNYQSDILTEETILDERRSELTALIEQTSGKDKLSKSLTDIGTIKGKFQDKIDRLNHEIHFFHDNDTCPTCRQNIDDTFRNGSIETKTGELKKIEEALSELVQKQKEAEASMDAMKLLVERMSNISVDINMRTSKVKNLEGTIQDLKEQIAKIEEKNSITISDNESIKKLEEERDDIAAEKKRLLELRDIYRISSTMLKDNGIKSKIIKQYIPVINKLINKYLAAMDFFVQFEIDETFNETIKSRFRDVFSYASFSEGEKTRIDLALLFAWRTIAKLRNSASTNLLILDEVFDGSLDATGSEDFLNILYSVTGEANIFVISHKTDQMKDKFDRVIEFEKRNNFSRIVNIEENAVA